MTTKTKPQREFFQTNKIVQGFKNKFERILLLTYFFSLLEFQWTELKLQRQFRMSWINLTQVQEME